MPAAQHVCFAHQQVGLAKGMRDLGEAVLELLHPWKRLSGYMKSILEIWVVLKIQQVGIKQSSWQNRPSTWSMWQLSVHTSPGSPQDSLGELQAKQKLPHDPRHMLTEHRWQQHLEQKKGAALARLETVIPHWGKC